MEDGTVVQIRNHETRGPLYRFEIERQQQAYIRRYEADFPYWLKMATWRWDEGAALIHGLEPRRIKLPYPDSAKELFPIIKSWVECREHAFCALRAGQLKESSKPVEFLRWAESLGYPIPEGLQGFYKACENGVHKKPTEQTSKVLTGVMEAQDEYVPLFPLLGNYWDKHLSELPEELQARLIAEGFEIGTGGFSWDESTPNNRRVRLTKMDKDNDPALAGQRHIDWHDASMDAPWWLSALDVEPEHAAMVLSRLNPERPADCEDPASIYVDGDESSPHRYRLLLREFEKEASTSPKPRTLMEWRTIAQQHNLRYHSWIDDYADAMGAPAGKVEAVPVISPSGGTSESLAEFRSMDKLTADELTITFVGDKFEGSSVVGTNNFLRITARKTRKNIALSSLNLVNMQSGGLNGQGVTLLGMTRKSRPMPSLANAQKISRLRTILKECLGVKGDPFDPKSAGWVPRFKIEDKRGEADERAKRDSLKYKTDSHEKRNRFGEKASEFADSYSTEPLEESSNLDSEATKFLKENGS